MKLLLQNTPSQHSRQKILSVPGRKGNLGGLCRIVVVSKGMPLYWVLGGGALALPDSFNILRWAKMLANGVGKHRWRSATNKCVFFFHFLSCISVNTDIILICDLSFFYLWVPALFRDKRIKFNFGRDNGIKFNISSRIKDKKWVCRDIKIENYLLKSVNRKLSVPNICLPQDLSKVYSAFFMLLMYGHLWFVCRVGLAKGLGMSDQPVLHTKECPFSRSPLIDCTVLWMWSEWNERNIIERFCCCRVDSCLFINMK